MTNVKLRLCIVYLKIKRFHCIHFGKADPSPKLEYVTQSTVTKDRKVIKSQKSLFTSLKLFDAKGNFVDLYHAF